MFMDVIIIDEIIEPDTVETEKCVHHVNSYYIKASVNSELTELI